MIVSYGPYMRINLITLLITFEYFVFLSNGLI